jgi:hypothetical protein
MKFDLKEYIILKLIEMYNEDKIKSKANNTKLNKNKYTVMRNFKTNDNIRFSSLIYDNYHTFVSFIAKEDFSFSIKFLDEIVEVKINKELEVIFNKKIKDVEKLNISTEFKEQLNYVFKYTNFAYIGFLNKNQIIDINKFI